MFTIIFILSFCQLITYSDSLNIIWDHTYCNTTIPTGYYYPFNSNCDLCHGTTLNFIAFNHDNFENLIRVRSEEEMLSCNADNPLDFVFNTKPISLNNQLTFTLNGPSNFYFGESVYFISTSNGSKLNAEQDHKYPNNSCLQLSFNLVAPQSDKCDNFLKCFNKSAITHELNRIGCGIEETVDTTTQTNGLSTVVVTSTNQNPSETNVSPVMYNSNPNSTMKSDFSTIYSPTATHGENVSATNQTITDKIVLTVVVSLVISIFCICVLSIGAIIILLHLMNWIKRQKNGNIQPSSRI